eukprot:790780-Rhodomonas_salina.1
MGHSGPGPLPTNCTIKGCVESPNSAPKAALPLWVTALAVTLPGKLLASLRALLLPSASSR